MQHFFKHKNRGTWKHLRSNKWHQLDHILCRKTDSGKHMDCYVKSSAECWTDHNMVILKHKFQIQKPKRFNNHKQKLHSQSDFKLRKLYPAKLIRRVTLREDLGKEIDKRLEHVLCDQTNISIT